MEKMETTILPGVEGLLMLTGGVQVKYYNWRVYAAGL